VNKTETTMLRLKLAIRENSRALYADRIAILLGYRDELPIHHFGGIPGCSPQLAAFLAGEALRKLTYVLVCSAASAYFSFRKTE
jgi:hypothetical protein